MRRDAHERGEESGRHVHAAKGERSEQPLEHQPRGHQGPDFDQQVEQTGVHEGHCQQPPPFAVRGARGEARAPTDERRRIAERARSDEHQHEDDNAETCQKCGRDGTRRAFAQRVTERIRLRATPVDFLSCPSKIFESLAKRLRPLFGAHGINHIPGDHGEGKDEHGTSARRRSRRVPAGRPFQEQFSSSAPQAGADDCKSWRGATRVVIPPWPVTEKHR